MSKAPNPKATISVVAATAGVSMPTVSKVINGRSDVAAGTRSRVQAALLEHSYEPPSARRPRQRAAAVAAFFDSLLSPYAAEVLSGVVTAANEAGIAVGVSLFPRTEDPGSIKGWDAWLARPRESAGAIIVSSRLAPERIEAVHHARVPLVVIDPMSPPRAEVVSIGATNFAGGLVAVDHLISLGHRRIAFLGGYRTSACNQGRLGGYRTALEAAGLATEPTLIEHGDFSWESGLEMGSRMLASATRPSAVFAASDATALGVLEAARRVDLRVPGDLSVVGFDDTYAAAWSTPPLTTVRQPLQDMGAMALRTLLRLGAGETLDSHHVELATRLVVRSSTAPPGEAR